MPKTIYRDEYRVLLDLLKQARLKSGLTQTDCSDELGRPQSYMSNVERGSRRVDLIQLRDMCQIFGTTLIKFVQAYERALSSNTPRQKPKRARSK